ncbi:MAG: multiheme c-type cytochrome [Planctomycetota bacterium]|nr:multiheme c-type cytochrome [Planctomycetota bacterium]
MTSQTPSQPNTPLNRKKYVPAVGPKLKKLLGVVFFLFAVLMVNSIYLVTITVAGVEYQNYFFQWMFLVHLVLGIAIVLPVVIFGIIHSRNTRHRPNKRAIKAGWATFIIALIVLITGFVLTRVDLFGFRFEVNNPLLRSTSYWLHVLTPLGAIWMFILHRLAGRRIKWKVGLTWGTVAAGFALIMLFFQAADPRAWDEVGPVSGEQYFFPALSRTSTGNFIPEHVLKNDAYCLECHGEVHKAWQHSAHKFASFNNPVYLFSVRQTREAMFERDGNVQGSRFCAGCHDPVPFLSGQFEDPRFDDPQYDLANDPAAQAGITCTVCHAISKINTLPGTSTPRGNGDYTIDEPTHYPFTFSKSPLLQWVNRQLVKAKPEFHKATFLKPLHKSAEFCGSCHKVHLPPELNAYKWLRGQNHYDAFFLSGVSGQGITSFYYPPKAQSNCNECHMPLELANEFGARTFETNPEKPTFGQLTVHDHQFPSANTAIATMVDMPDPEWAIQKHKDFNEGVMRLDIFALRKGGAIDGELLGPIRPEIPTLTPGESYLVETIIRTVKMGHVFTQGTSDSNEIWMDVEVTLNGELLGRSGGRDETYNAVDPWSHKVNSFVLDRDGNRINRRNAQDIFVALYTNQIPPGAADSLHYLLNVPEDAAGSITIDVKLQYRKFDTELMALVEDDPEYRNELPIMLLAHDRVTLPIGDANAQPIEDDRGIPMWQRWNDYGIGLIRNRQFRQAEEAFTKVEELGRPDGPINLARVYIQDGRVSTKAPLALQRARDFDPPARAWSVLWFSGLVEKLNGNLDEAISNFKQIIEGGFEQAQGKNFDFSKDYRLLNELGITIYERAKQERGEANKASRETMLREAISYFDRALVFDSENATAHFNLSLIYRDLGETKLAEEHASLHGYYKMDDNARDQAVAKARLQYPAADHASENVVIYDLHRPGAYELPQEQK